MQIVPSITTCHHCKVLWISAIVLFPAFFGKFSDCLWSRLWCQWDNIIHFDWTYFFPFREGESLKFQPAPYPTQLYFTFSRISWLLLCLQILEAYSMGQSMNKQVSEVMNSAFHVLAPHESGFDGRYWTMKTEKTGRRVSGAILNGRSFQKAWD